MSKTGRHFKGSMIDMDLFYRFAHSKRQIAITIDEQYSATIGKRESRQRFSGPDIAANDPVILFGHELLMGTNGNSIHLAPSCRAAR